MRADDVFKVGGIPDVTFIPPPNFPKIKAQITSKNTIVVVEGPSGTGKTTAITKGYADEKVEIEWLNARKQKDLNRIQNLIKCPSEKSSEITVIDDFHRLNRELQSKLSDLLKLKVDDPEVFLGSMIIIGINEVGKTLIEFSPDIAKRITRIKIGKADKSAVRILYEAAKKHLNIEIDNMEDIFNISSGDYWTLQS